MYELKTKIENGVELYWNDAFGEWREKRLSQKKQNPDEMPFDDWVEWSRGKPVDKNGRVIISSRSNYSESTIDYSMLDGGS